MLKKSKEKFVNPFKYTINFWNAVSIQLFLHTKLFWHSLCTYLGSLKFLIWISIFNFIRLIVKSSSIFILMITKNASVWKKNLSFIILFFFLAASSNDDSSELKVQISVLKNQSEETSKKLQTEVIIFKMCIYYYLKMND